jgi:hypothetical protein
VDRTIPPGTPEGEDAGAVVGVVGLDSTGRNSIMVSSRAIPASRRMGDILDKADPAGRIAVRVVDRADVPADRTARSSVAHAP